MIALSLTTSMATVRVLALESLGPNLDSVLDFLKCFPCVEKLYITFNRLKTVKNARIYNPLDPIECLELHLKKVVVNDYRGMRPDVDFAFFILNAKVLKDMYRGNQSPTPPSSFPPPSRPPQAPRAAGALRPPSSVSRGGRRRKVAFCHKTPCLFL